MPNSPHLQSHWRKLVDSFREASKQRLLPEYDYQQDRCQNHRYYR